jgi:crotonobetainyl-CoA:carnitine CoA-transferase CaiB-like acyl-CoA transferase
VVRAQSRPWRLWSGAVVIADHAEVRWLSRHLPVGATELPLAGVRVLDQTDEWGELCTRLLGDLGADVIRVEPIGGSQSRRAAPVRQGISLGWVFRNGGKRVLELDMSRGGQPEFDRLLADADVLVTSGPIDHELLRRFPRCVGLAITPYGLTGPYATWQATDAVIAATAAQASKAGASDREPLPPPGRFCDHIASATAAFATLCALRHRNANGIRSVLDFSVNEAVAQMSDWSLPNGVARLRAGLPLEARHGSGPVYPVFPCRDGHVRLVILSPRQWHAMRAWLGEPDYLQDPDLDGFMARFQLADAVLNPLYREFFAERDMDAVCIEAQSRGIVCTPVYSAAAALSCEHLRARDSFVTPEIAPGLRPALHAGFFELQGRRAGPRWTDAAGDSGEIPPVPGTPPPATTSTTASAIGSTTSALTGLRVLDFGHGAVGVEIGRMFAEFGADVIKIESRAYPDFIRLQTARENTPSFTSSNRSKRSLGVNAKSGRGRDFLLQLASKSDLVIENNAAGVMDSLGLGFEHFARVNPEIVMASSQLMGTTGPWAQWRGYGPSTLAPSGVLSLWDYADTTDPTGGGTIFPDQFVGRLGAVAALASLIGREAGTTSGTHIEIAQIECAVGAIGDLLAAESVEPGSVHALGGAHESQSPWGVYPAFGDDQWVIINCRDERDWNGLVAASADVLERWSYEAALGAGKTAVDQQLTTWTSGLDKHEIARRCQSQGVPAGPVLSGAELATDPHCHARHFPVEIDQPDIGPMVLEGPAWASDAMPPPIYRPAPTIGEHTVEVARDLLGLTDKVIEEMFDAGVFETTAAEGGPGTFKTTGGANEPI